MNANRTTEKNVQKNVTVKPAVKTEVVKNTAELTLAQLIALVEEKNTPKTSYVVAKFQNASYLFEVFSNGTIQAYVGKRHVAFHLSDCTSYTYPDRNRRRVPDNATPAHIPAEQFMDMKWSIRVALEAEDRVSKKRNNYERRNCSCRY